MEAGAKDRKRESILEAAIEVFIEGGYEQASMDRIAERAEASKRTVYNYFPSKEVLFQSVLQKIGRDCHPVVPITYDPSRSLELQLTAFAQMKIANLANPKWVGMMRVVFAVFARNPSLAKQAIGSVHDPDGSFVPWLKAAHADGRLKVKDAEAASDVFGAMIGGGIWWPRVFFDMYDEKRTQAQLQEYIRTFLARYGV